MFPLLFPGSLDFVKSYFKVILLSVLAIALTSFISYHYVKMTWYEKQFEQMKSEIETARIKIDTYELKLKFSKDNVDQLKIYYENELQTCKSQLKREGELQKEEILHSNKLK